MRTGSDIAAETMAAPAKNVPKTRGNKRCMVNEYVSFAMDRSSYWKQACCELRRLRRGLQLRPQGQEVEQRGADGRAGDDNRHGKRRVVDEAEKDGRERSDQELVGAKQRRRGAGDFPVPHHRNGRSVREYEALGRNIHEN